MIILFFLEKKFIFFTTIGFKIIIIIFRVDICLRHIHPHTSLCAFRNFLKWMNILWRVLYTFWIPEAYLFRYYLHCSNLERSQLLRYYKYIILHHQLHCRCSDFCILNVLDYPYCRVNNKHRVLEFESNEMFEFKLSKKKKKRSVSRNKTLLPACRLRMKKTYRRFICKATTWKSLGSTSLLRRCKTLFLFSIYDNFVKLRPELYVGITFIGKNIH